jgi:hypothetical protein
VADLRMYRLSTRYVYATVSSSEDPSGSPVWMAVKPFGIPAGDSDLLTAEWVPGETLSNGQRRARVLIGPESDTGQLDPGPYRVYYKTDLDPEVPFEPVDYRLLVTSESTVVPPSTPALAAVAFSGEYADLIGVPAGGGSGGGAGTLPLFNVEAYGALGDGTTDDYAAIRAAWDAMLLSPVGGLLYFPRAVTYRIVADTSARMTVSADQARALFPIPMRSRALTKLSYGVLGVGEPYSVRAADLGASPGQVQTASVLQVDYSTPFAWSDTIGLPCVFGATDADMTDSSGNTFSNVHFTADNLIIRQPVDPSLCALNLEQCSTVRIGRLRIDVDAVLDDIPEPTHPTGAALLLPRSNNNVVVQVDSLITEGYYAGIPLTEHLELRTAIALRCKIAVHTRRLCSHNGLVNHLKIEQCPWGFSGYDPAGAGPDDGVVAFEGWTGHITYVDVEDYAYNGTVTWIYAPTAGSHINDPQGTFNGTISFWGRINSEPPDPTGIGIGPGGGSSSLYVIGPSGTNSPIAVYGADHTVAATRLSPPSGPDITEYSLFSGAAGPGSHVTDASPINLGVRVQVTSPVTATKLAFWRATASVVGPITGRLWQVTGPGTGVAVSADVTFTLDGTGWHYADIDVPLEVGQIYVPTVRFPDGWCLTNSYWTSGDGGSGIINGPLVAYSSPDAGGQGWFSSGALSVFPASASSNAANYWVDLVVEATT